MVFSKVGLGDGNGQISLSVTPALPVWREKAVLQKLQKFGKVRLRGNLKPAKRRGNLDTLKDARVLEVLRCMDRHLVVLYQQDRNSVEVYELGMEHDI